MNARSRQLLTALTTLSLALFLFGCAGNLARGPHPYVRVETSMGNILLELDREHAPLSVDNFLHYVKDKHYDGTLMHRVVPGFVIQGGGYDASFVERPNRAPIPLESHNGLSNSRGTLAMARDEEPDTATSEFYINLVDNLKLNPHPENPARKWGYAVFGRVVEGMDVVDRIAAVKTGVVGPFEQDSPLTPIIITHVRVVSPPKS